MTKKNELYAWMTPNILAPVRQWVPKGHHWHWDLKSIWRVLNPCLLRLVGPEFDIRMCRVSAVRHMPVYQRCRHTDPLQRMEQDPTIRSVLSVILELYRDNDGTQFQEILRNMSEMDNRMRSEHMAPPPVPPVHL